jgi:hypothetical protein
MGHPVEDVLPASKAIHLLAAGCDRRGASQHDQHELLLRLLHDVPFPLLKSNDP